MSEHPSATSSAVVRILAFTWGRVSRMLLPPRIGRRGKLLLLLFELIKTAKARVLRFERFEVGADGW